MEMDHEHNDAPKGVEAMLFSSLRFPLILIDCVVLPQSPMLFELKDV